MTALRWASGVALVLAYGVIVLGAWVRATGSGISCPDWPTCYGHWLPLPGEIPPDAGYAYYQVMLEWVHRLLAGVILGPLILVVGAFCWRARGRDARMPLYAAITVFLLLVQAALGGLTVLDQNSPWSVALHLATALLLLSALGLIFVRAAIPMPGAAGGARPLAVLVWLIALATMASAAMVAKSGAALACSTWPLCDGALIPDLADPSVRLNFTHRLLAAATGLGVLALFLACRGQPSLRPSATWALGLVIAEIALGGVTVLREIALGEALLHQALGVLTFLILALLMWRALAPSGQAASHATDVGLSRP